MPRVKNPNKKKKLISPFRKLDFISSSALSIKEIIAENLNNPEFIPFLHAEIEKEKQEAANNQKYSKVLKTIISLLKDNPQIEDKILTIVRLELKSMKPKKE